VYLHRPPFSSGEHGSNLAVREAFVPLFERHRVPLVFAGHDHDYERTIAINGVTYVVTGGGGRGTRPVGASPFTAFSESTLHFIAASVSDSALVLHAIDATGQTFDSLQLTR
jgi:acid phosphatase type 7